MIEETKYRYSEIFYSSQGEGKWITGDPCVWIRWFLCNLQCNGFGQKDPTDKDTYVLPYLDYDVSGVEKLKDLPIWTTGCDSSYSWSKKYRHLCPQQTAKEIADTLVDAMRNEFNPEGLFFHPHSREEITLTMTGGEPMFSQPAIVALLNEFEQRTNKPAAITIETNGTQFIKPELKTVINKFLKITNEDSNWIWSNPKRVSSWFWSVSPKLFNTSGEIAKRAIKPEVVGEYAEFSDNGQLKFVVNGTKDSWEELEIVIEQFRNAGVNWPVSIMPVGATVEDQSTSTVADIANEAIKRGYHISARVQAYLFGNTIGV